MTALRVLAVELGDPRRAWCYGCGAEDAQECDLVALAEVGTVTLGRIEACEVCGSVRWRCRFCGGLTMVDAADIVGHLRLEFGTVPEGGGRGG